MIQIDDQHEGGRFVSKHWLVFNTIDKIVVNLTGVVLLNLRVENNFFRDRVKMSITCPADLKRYGIGVNRTDPGKPTMHSILTVDDFTVFVTPMSVHQTGAEGQFAVDGFGMVADNVAWPPFIEAYPQPDLDQVRIYADVALLGKPLAYLDRIAYDVTLCGHLTWTSHGHL